MPLPEPTADGFESAFRLAIAALVGLAVGTEREWSGHATGPLGRFAGLRTFLLLGLLGGAAGLLSSWSHPLAAATLLAGGAVFSVSAYVMAVRRPDSELEGTTEVAALVVLALAALAGIGQLALASGTVALVVLALGEKERLHWFVRRIGEREMRATLQFLVLALVVLPLLPEGPYGPLGGFRPRTLWSIVLLFSGLNFAGYLARRAVGAERGYGVAGLLGGIVSSTAVTLQFSRTSKREPSLGQPLAFGVIGACIVLLPRVGLMTVLLNRAVARALAPYLIVPFAAGVAMVAIVLWRHPRSNGSVETSELHSPLRLWSAIQMALLFQIAIMAITFTQQLWGSAGVLVSAAALGLTDVDALTVSMSGLGQQPGSVELAARGIGIGLLANTAFKLSIAIVLGGSTFRRVVAAGLGVFIVVFALMLFLIGH